MSNPIDPDLLLIEAQRKEIAAIRRVVHMIQPSTFYLSVRALALLTIGRGAFIRAIADRAT